MDAWILVPCLTQLRADVNTIAPARDHASDGSIGDAAHSSSSDHTPDEISDALRSKDNDSRNEVHAVDIDSDLRTPGLTMEQIVQFVLQRCRSGAENRLRYIIFNRRIWSASSGWRQQPYTGPSPHDHHAHFSASYNSAREADTSSWKLEDIPVALTADDKKWITNEIKETVKDALGAWGKVDPVRTTYNRSGYLANEFAPKVNGDLERVVAALTELKNMISFTHPGTNDDK